MIIRGWTRWRGLVGKHFPLHNIQVVAVGQPLNKVQRFLTRLNQLGVPSSSMIRPTKDELAGRLLVRDKQGDEIVICSLDKVFERESLLLFLAELRQRSVKVESVAQHNWLGRKRRASR